MTSKQRQLWKGGVKHVLLLAGAVVMLYPLLWMFSSSLKPEELIFREMGLWPRIVTLGNYTKGWTAIGVPFSRLFANSFIISIACVIGNVATCALTAYAFARLDFKLKNFWFALMLVTMMLPMQVTLIPRYILFFKAGWLNTFLPLTVPHFMAVDAFFIFLIVQFIRGLPKDLEDAASIDGASEFQTFLRVIVPLCAPALATTAIFTFIWSWDNFMSQLLYLSKVSVYTVPLGLRAFLDATDKSSYGALFAMSVLSLIPAFVIFVTAQKQLVEGVSTTGLKG
jgi:multiple sugar transport system permease protein